MAEKYILYLEVLFAAIDDLDWHFAQLKMNGTIQGISLLRSSYRKL
jgi:hypothetical protein